MVAAVSSTTKTTNPNVLPNVTTAPAKPKRAPLLPSETYNNGAPPLPRPLKSRDVTSTINSDSTTSSCSSSSTTSSSSNSVSTPPRRQSVVSRTNVVTPASAVNTKRTGEMSATAKTLTRTSARSLLVSFQGESFALPVSKVANNGIQERRKAETMAARTRSLESLQPVRSRQGSFMSMSVDFTNEKMKLSGSGTDSVKKYQKTMRNESKYMHIKQEIKDIYKSVDKVVFDSDNSDHVSDTESVSSGSNVRGGGPRAIVVPARFWQETINLLRRVQPGPVSPLMSKTSKLISNKILDDDGPKLSPPRSSFSSAVPQRSPRKKAIPSSLSMGMNGPSLIHSGLDSISNHNLGNTPSILSFSADLKRGKKLGENKLVDAQVLRLLHNKHLQWRFANAKVDAAMLVQRATARKSLYNAWVTISKMWISVLSKRVEMQNLKHNLKLHSVLKKQISYLENWDVADRDHSISLAGTILALESSSLRLPVLSGAKADVQDLKEAIHAAFDVMQKMEVSIFSLLTKVDHVNSMASELASAMKSESSLLDQCMDLLSRLTLLEDCSLRTHTLQLVASGATTGL